MTRRKIIDSPELPIPKRKSPLILFNHPDFPTNFQAYNYEKEKKTFSVSTQTILHSNTEKFVLNLSKTTQTKNVFESIAVQTENVETIDLKNFGNVFNNSPIKFPTELPNIFQSSIKRSNLVISEIYQAASRYSPMATLLTPIGNVYSFSFYLQAQNLRKKVSRIEDDNESLVLQLKKMATKARSMLMN